MIKHDLYTQLQKAIEQFRLEAMESKAVIIVAEGQIIMLKELIERERDKLSSNERCIQMAQNSLDGMMDQIRRDALNDKKNKP